MYRTDVIDPARGRGVLGSFFLIDDPLRVPVRIHLLDVGDLDALLQVLRRLQYGRLQVWHAQAFGLVEGYVVERPSFRHVADLYDRGGLLQDVLVPFVRQLEVR